MKIEDIIFLIFIAAIIVIALWLLNGSPTEVNSLIAIALFVASSEMLLWRKLFEIDKKFMISFTKVKNELGNIKDLVKRR